MDTGVVPDTALCLITTEWATRAVQQWRHHAIVCVKASGEHFERSC